MKLLSPIEMMIDQAVGKSPVVQDEPIDGRAEILLKIADAAKAWWISRRPDIYSEADHLQAPTINCFGGDSERELAMVVVEWVKMGG